MTARLKTVRANMVATHFCMEGSSPLVRVSDENSDSAKPLLSHHLDNVPALGLSRVLPSGHSLANQQHPTVSRDHFIPRDIKRYWGKLRGFIHDDTTTNAVNSYPVLHDGEFPLSRTFESR